MFDNLFYSIQRFFSEFKFWYVIEPWQQCLRVRLGKHVQRKGPGLHLRIPYLDSIHAESSRYRTALCASQTLTTKDGKVLVCSVATGHSLGDIYKFYTTLANADDTINQTVSSFVADYVSRTDSTELEVNKLSDDLTSMLHEEFEKYGLKDVTVRIQDFAYIKAFRLIQDQRYQNGHHTVGTPR